MGSDPDQTLKPAPGGFTSEIAKGVVDRERPSPSPTNSFITFEDELDDGGSMAKTTAETLISTEADGLCEDQPRRAMLGLEVHLGQGRHCMAGLPTRLGCSGLFDV
jgi:hypothetical protein